MHEARYPVISQSITAVMIWDRKVKSITTYEKAMVGKSDHIFWCSVAHLKGLYYVKFSLPMFANDNYLI